MNFIKGVMIGTAVTASVMMVCSNEMVVQKKKMMRTGKRLMKKMGITVL